jgi:MFS family permease
VIVVVGGTRAALFANSALFVAIATTIATTRGLPEHPAQPTAATGRLRAALAHVRAHRGIRTIVGFQIAAVLVFTIAIPVEVVFAQHSLHAGTGGYGALLSAWGAGAVLGSVVYARWRRLPNRVLIGLGAASLGTGMLVMAVAPSLAIAVVGSALAGIANGLEAVAVRTALQEQVEQHWMALMMSLNESIFQAVPGGGILIGGAITALAGPRVALAVAGGGALLIAVAAWFVVPVERGPALAADPPEERDAVPAGASPTPATRQ